MLCDVSNMSFRNTFTTSFIYQASDEVRDANAAVSKVFQDWCGSTLASMVDERGYGHYSGWYKSLSGEREAKEDLEQIVSSLEKATKVPFELTVLVESGPAITYRIEPRK